MKLYLILFVVIKSINSVLTSEKLALTIQEINSRFSSETNVIIDFDNYLADEMNLTTLRIPTIVIRQKVDFQFIYELDKDILVSAFITESSTTDIQQSLSYILHRMHHVNVMFILLDSTDALPIFNWAWMNGFKNSIALYCSEGRVHLFEYQPFPELTLVNIDTINESRLQEPITNFYQHPIRTPMANDAPRAFRYVNRNGKVIYSGLFLKLFILFIDHYNATLEEVILPEPYPHGLLIPDMIVALKEGKIDISLHPFLQLYDEYLCSYSFALAYFYLMVPYARQVDQYMYFILPFDGWTWTAITGTVFLFALGISAGSKAVLGHFEFGSALLQGFSGVLNISFSYRAHNSKVLVCVYILLSVVGMMLSNMYLAQLSTFLTTHAYGKQINTIEDVVASQLPITIAKYDQKVYISLGVSNNIIRKIEGIDVNTWYQQRRILNTSRIDIISKEKYSFFTYQQRYLKNPMVKIIDKPLLGLAPGFALPFTSSYAELYSVYFQRTIEAGIFRQFEEDLNKDGIATGLISFIEPEPPELVPLSVQHFKISLFLLGSGFAMAALCFCFEIIYDKLEHKYNIFHITMLLVNL